jgi:hypothetical protein
MQSNTTNTLAILRGEQRSNRYRYRHCVAAAAREIGIPPTWIWFWLLGQQLGSVTSLRCVWVRLQDVQKLFANLDAIRAAYFATGEFLTSPQAIQTVVERWPDAGVRPYIRFQPTGKVVPIRAPKASNPVLCEEKKSKEVA